MHRRFCILRIAALLILKQALWATAATQPTYDVRISQPRRIEPGSVIVDSARKPWTHLVIKSQPRAAHGDVAKINKRDRAYTSLFCTVMAAQVKETRNDKFQLNAVGIGCTTKIAGKDTVVSPATQKQLGAKLGIIEGVLLNSFHKRQANVRVVLRGPNIALVDAPVVARIDNTNKHIWLRHAILVNPENGHVDNLIWMIDPVDGDNGKLVGSIEHMKPNHVDDCQLYVDSSKYSFGVPTEMAFAIQHAPRGQCEFAVPEHMLPLVALNRYTTEQGAEMELSLRALLRPHVAQAILK